MGGLTDAGFRTLVISLIVGTMLVVAVFIICQFCCRNYRKRKSKWGNNAARSTISMEEGDDDLKKPIPSDEESETNEKAMLLNKSYDSMPPLEPPYEEENDHPNQENQESPPPPYEGGGKTPGHGLPHIEEEGDIHRRNGYLTPSSGISRQTSPSRSEGSDQSIETSDQTLPRLSESDNSEIGEVEVHSAEPPDEDTNTNEQNAIKMDHHLQKDDCALVLSSEPLDEHNAHDQNVIKTDDYLQTDDHALVPSNEPPEVEDNANDQNVSNTDHLQTDVNTLYPNIEKLNEPSEASSVKEEMINQQEQPEEASSQLLVGSETAESESQVNDSSDHKQNPPVPLDSDLAHLSAPQREPESLADPSDEKSKDISAEQTGLEDKEQEHSGIMSPVEVPSNTTETVEANQSLVSATSDVPTSMEVTKEGDEDAKAASGDDGEDNVTKEDGNDGKTADGTVHQADGNITSTESANCSDPSKVQNLEDSPKETMMEVSSDKQEEVKQDQPVPIPVAIQVEPSAPQNKD